MLEFLDQITPGMDLEVCKTLQKLLTKQGLTFVLGAAVQGAEPARTASRVTYKLRKDDSDGIARRRRRARRHRPPPLHRRPRPRRRSASR